jgi:hypothetical protein
VWLAWVPMILGLLTIIMAISFSTIMAGEAIPSADEQWKPTFLARIKLLQKCFYLLSFILVTSTVSIFHFLSLPLELLADQPLKVTLNQFINANTTFLGGMFTATLFVTFAPASILLFKHAREHRRGPAVASNFTQWLHESVFESTKKQVMNALFMVAPMLVGPLSNLLLQVLVSKICSKH